MIFSLILPLAGNAQSGNQKPVNAKVWQKDSDYVDELLRQADSLSLVNLDSAQTTSEMALSLSEKLNYNTGKAASMRNIGWISEFRRNYFQADRYYKMSLEIYEQTGDFSAISKVQNHLGFLYEFLGDRETAVDYYSKAIENARYVNDSESLSRAILNLGRVYSFDRESYDRAIEIYLESREIFEEIDNPMGLCISNLEIGKIYVKQNSPTQALPFLFDALYGEYRFGFPSTILNYIGWAYLELGELENAKDFYQQSLSSAVEDEIAPDEMSANLGLGHVHIGLGLPSRAIDYFNKVLSNARKTGHMQNRKHALEGLSEAYLKMKDFRNAALTYQSHAAVQDSLFLKKVNEQEELNSELHGTIKRIYENQRLEFELQREKDQQAKRLLFLGLGLFLFISCGLVNRFLFIRKAKKAIAQEKDRSDEILLNILPEETADELKKSGTIKAKQFDEITVLFTDFKGFSAVARELSAENLVESVDYYFRRFDAIVEKHGLEKIKTIGDAYMCAGGIPIPNKTHAENALKAAIEIRDFVDANKRNPPPGIHPFEIRIGLSSGPVIAGVVGTKKFAYDIWGCTVNNAARMESCSQPGFINVSETTQNLLKDKYSFTYRGEMKVKNGQILKMYFAEVACPVNA